MTKPERPQMIAVPAGPFLMGTSTGEIETIATWDDEARQWQAKDRFRRERPQTMLRLPAYWIGRYPVTVGAYRPFIEAGGYGEKRYWTAAGWKWSVATGRTEPHLWRDERWTGDQELPAVGVSWYEATAYARWLSEREGHPYRLPSEAEWEKAARGTEGRLFPWGDRYELGRANTRELGLERTTRVSAYSVTDLSPHNCADMGGNGSEWTASAFRPYPYEADDGREDPSGEALRVTRGGSWFKGQLRARTAARGYNDPWFADDDLGLRLASSAPQDTPPDTRGPQLREGR